MEITGDLGLVRLVTQGNHASAHLELVPVAPHDGWRFDADGPRNEVGTAVVTALHEAEPHPGLAWAINAWNELASLSGSGDVTIPGRRARR